MRVVLCAALALAAGAGQGLAATKKEKDCAHQGAIVSAVRQARLDRVKERDVAKAVADSGPTWPENYNAAIPLITPWVYEQKMRDVRKKDLGAAWLELCLQQ